MLALAHTALAVPAPHAPATMAGLELGNARLTALAPSASSWTLDHRVYEEPGQFTGCPDGQRNAAESECLGAVQEATAALGVPLQDRTIKVVDAGADGWVPAGCSYSRGHGKRAMFNRNPAGRSSGSYPLACIEDAAQRPVDDEQQSLDGHVRPGEVERGLAQLAAMIAGNVEKTDVVQYTCATTSVPLACPALAAKMKTGQVLPDLSIPADARWLFEGPSYSQEIFITLAAANGGCQTTAEQSSEVVGFRLCPLSNGAVLAGTQNNEQTIKAIDWINKEKQGVTHGFFMQGHTMEYDAEHAAAAKEGRAPDPAKMRDYAGRDMCLPKYLGVGCCEFGGNCCRTPPSDVGFAEYEDCNAELGNRERFRAQVGSAKVQFLVPWHLLPPEKLPEGPYFFTNSLAAEFDCKTLLQTADDIPGGYQWLNPGHSQFAISGAGINPKSPDGTPLIASHQCIVACDGDACYPGSIVWLADRVVYEALKAA